MERKIGEIFEYDGEWYQCVESACNKECYFYNKSLHKTIADINGNGFGACNACFRNDNKSVIFKKLEKDGEPFTCNIHGEERLVWMQEYKLYDVNFCKGNALLMYVSDYKHKRIAIEIKQNKEDMEEKKLNLKPFDIQKAREGKPVCTRDGRKARIICYDRKDIKPIVALVTCINGTSVIEKAFYYFEDGCHLSKNDNNIYDLMMLPEKKEGWINIYKKSNDECYFAHIYDTKALAEIGKNAGCIATVRIEWEE